MGFVWFFRCCLYPATAILFSQFFYGLTATEGAVTRCGTNCFTSWHYLAFVLVIMCFAYILTTSTQTMVTAVFKTLKK